MSNTNNNNNNNIIPYKSESDKRSYRYIILENNLKVLLISDDITDKMACSLDVNIGQLCDPNELPGLAHFLEHMLFLGTKKYPDENAYSSFIQSHGGMENAYTSLEHTNYSFDLLDSDSFEEALDRFAQFFISPLFTESASTREIEAVNNEHAKNLQNDIWRLYQLCRSISDPNHPFSKFGSGNRDTLLTEPSKNNINVRDELLKFHKTYYSANLMSLCVLSKHSLDELETMVRDKFSDIPNFDKERPVISNKPFTNEFGLNNVYKIVPVRSEENLRILFQYNESLEQYYHEKPDLLLSNIIGWEGRGSILSYLKSKSYATSLSSGCDSSCSTTAFSLFIIDIELTKLGFDHVNDIIEAVYAYINLLMNASDDEWKRLYDEFKQLQDINFRFKAKEKPYHYATMLTERIHLYKPEEILDGPHIFKQFNVELLRKCVNQLIPDNMMIFITSQSFEDIVEHTESWYGTKYHVESIDENIKLFIKAKNNELHLPEPNPFISTNFDLYINERENKVSSDDNLYPKLVYESDKSKVWYKMDDVFLKPKCNILLSVFSSRAFNTPKNSMLTIMYINMLEDYLNEFCYPALIAGLSANISITKVGFQIKFSGYNDKISILVQHYIKSMRDLELSQSRFQMFLEQSLKEALNFKMAQPYQHAMYFQGLFTEESRYHIDENIKVLRQITINDLRVHIRKLMMETYLEGLIHGNINKEGAIDLIKYAESNLVYSPVHSSLQLLPRVVQLPMGEEFIVEENTMNPQDTNSAIHVYFQFGDEQMTVNTLMRAKLLSQLIAEPCFDQLRTKEQLGYLVHASSMSQRQVEGLRLIVQSSSKKAQYLDDRIESFLYEFRTKVLQNMSNEEFDTNKQAVLAKILQNDTTLMEETSRWWNEITTKRYKFSIREEKVKVLKDLNKHDMIEFFDKYVAANSITRRRLACHMNAQCAIVDDELDQLESNTIVKNDGYIKNKSLKLTKLTPQEYLLFRMSKPLFPQFDGICSLLHKEANKKN